MYRKQLTIALLLVTVCAALLFLGGLSWFSSAQAQGSAPTARRINAPYTSNLESIPIASRSVFWFGEVTPQSNYVDGRVIYNDQALYVTLHIFDRLLWYDPSPSPAGMVEWDAATLFVNLEGNTGSAPSSQSYRFVAQLGNTQERDAYQAAYRGDGAGWQAVSVAFDSETLWRGEGLNNGAAARGWVVTFEIPFNSLGLSGRPADESVWGLAVAVHDRDQSEDDDLPVQWWPESASMTQPDSWGQLSFGEPGYSPPVATPGEWVTVRQGLNGAVVPDAHVGGHTTCGDEYAPHYFEGWGDANYAQYEQINVQNQWDVADWPCFSKYYVTFPLDSLPASKEIISATLTLHQFGNAEPSQAPVSNIQVLTVGEGWDEGSLTWNNAPLAVENVASARVAPLQEWPGWPGVPRSWDLSRAVAQAYASGQPLRLVLYSADGAYHSGKYFSSSDAPDWNAAARPTLRVLWGNGEPAGTPTPWPTPIGGYDHDEFLPLLRR